MGGAGYCAEVVEGWIRRWEGRIQALAQANALQLRSNAFYIAGIVAVFSRIEQIKLQGWENAVRLQDFFA